MKKSQGAWSSDCQTEDPFSQKKCRWQCLTFPPLALSRSATCGFSEFPVPGTAGFPFLPMDLKGKKVLVVGLARTGLAAVQFLSKRGAKVKVSDAKTAGELAPFLGPLSGLSVDRELGRAHRILFCRRGPDRDEPGGPSGPPARGQIAGRGNPGHQRGGAGLPVPAAPPDRDHRDQRQDDDHDPHGRNAQRERQESSSWAGTSATR